MLFRMLILKTNSILSEHLLLYEELILPLTDSAISGHLVMNYFLVEWF